MQTVEQNYKSNKASSREIESNVLSNRQVNVAALIGSNKIADVLNAPIMIPGAKKSY